MRTEPPKALKRREALAGMATAAVASATVASPRAAHGAFTASSADSAGNVRPLLVGQRIPDVALQRGLHRAPER